MGPVMTCFQQLDAIVWIPDNMQQSAKSFMAPNKTERMNPVGREEEYPTHETAITQRSAHKTAITPQSTKNIHYTHETQTK
jgi:hypothetical protein